MKHECPRWQLNKKTDTFRIKDVCLYVDMSFNVIANIRDHGEGHKVVKIGVIWKAVMSWVCMTNVKYQFSINTKQNRESKGVYKEKNTDVQTKNYMLPDSISES